MLNMEFCSLQVKILVMANLFFKRNNMLKINSMKCKKRSILKPGDLLTNIVGAGIGRSAQFD